MRKGRGQKYRSKGRIMADILRAVQEDGSAKVTHILYKANLSHDRLTKYLGQLEGSGLLESIELQERTMYRITDKGIEFLSEFRRMEDFAEAFGLDI
jgi:predicted transcriptional regulator